MMFKHKIIITEKKSKWKERKRKRNKALGSSLGSLRNKSAIILINLHHS